MLCKTCVDGVIQKYDLGDINQKGEKVLREKTFCVLISKEISGLVECSKYKKGEIANG
jgi:hypothetical protein